MFHKPDSSLGGGKNQKKAMDTPLRKSDRRKLRDVAAGFFQRHKTNVSPELMDAIFMQDSLVVRKLSHAQLNKVQLFYRGPSSEDSDSQWPYSTTTECVWTTIDTGPGEPPIQCPSVAMLSLVADFPSAVIPSQASKYLCRGAHLMRAGIISLPSNSNTIVGIQVMGNPQPFAVGLLRPAFKNETSGIGVHVWMCYGDDVYKSTTALAETGTGRINPVGGAPFGNGHYGNVGFMDGVIVRPIMSVEEDDEQEDDEQEDGQDLDQVSSSKNPVETADDAAAIEAKTNPPQQPEEEPPISQDDVLHQSTCRALVNIKDKDLPMLSSSFYANHVLQHRPPDTMIQLKQTYYKKFGTYLIHQQNCGLLTLSQDKKDNNPAGYLKSINRAHEDLRGIRKTKTEELPGAKMQKVVSLFVVPHYFVSLMRLDPDDVKAANAKSEERRGTSMLTSPEVRAILEKYCNENDLISVDATDVTLNAPLTDALYKKSKASAPDSLSRKELNDAWTAKMEPAYAVVQMPGSRITKLARGTPPMIQMEVSRLGGNKLVTRVRGMEEYGIDGEAFCKDVSKRFACAGTVVTDDPQMGALKKGNCEVVFQGHLVEELRALLLGDERLSTHGGAKRSEYSLPKQSIAVTLKKGIPAKKRK